MKRTIKLVSAASLLLAAVSPIQSARAANPNVTLPASLSIAPSSSAVSLGLSNAVIGGSLSGTVVVAIKLKNAMYGEFLKQPVTTGLTITDTYGGSTSTGFYELIETGTVSNINAALAAMTITTPANVGAPSLWITADTYDANWKYNTNTHHFYWVGATAESYDSANSEAKGKSYLGFTGYLATVTSVSEKNFVHGLTASSFWLGGTDGISVANTWRWDPNGGSPEANTIFYDVNSVGPNGYYNWNSGEPNGGTRENWLQMGADGGWNDLDNGGTSLLAMVEVGASGGDLFGATAGTNVSTMPINTTSGSSIIYGLTEQSYFSNGTVAPNLGQALQQCGTTVYQQPQISYQYGASASYGPYAANTASGAPSYTGDTCYLDDFWITRWQGYVSVPSTANGVKFQAISDDGETVTVNATSVISAWGDFQVTKTSGVISGINKNAYYAIDVFFYENAGGASMSLWWDLGDGNGFVLIPAWAFTTTAPATTTATYSLSSGASATYRIASTITETSTIGGKVTFIAQGKAIPGCKGINTVFSAGTYNATCTWKPSFHRDTTVTSSFTPYGNQYTTANVTKVIPVAARATKR